MSFWKTDAHSDARSLARAFIARNSLMVALLAACPIRLKNFAALETQERLRKIGETWWIFIKDTKSKRADHRPVPDFLTGAIERYLDAYRPILLGNSVDPEKGRNSHCLMRHRIPAEATSALWISRLRGPMGYGQVERVITQTSYRLIGVSISPHLFRVAAATTAALYSQSPHLAGALLQHSDERITIEHYIRANSLSVTRQFAALIGNLRDGP